MSANKPCAECGKTDRTEEPGEYALLKLTQGRLQLHLDKPGTTASVVRVTTCNNCGLVTLHEAP
jgi:hypothetical protein